MKNSDQPINPFIPPHPWDNESGSGFMGLTKREYFAGQVIHGLISGRYQSTAEDMANNKWRISRYALEIADELLKQLEQPTTPCPPTS